jgi:hypothetical protein
MFARLCLSVTTLLILNSAALHGAAPCEPPKPCYVEKTICVPLWVMETRTIKETHYRKEPRVREIPYYKQVTVDVPLECKRTEFVRVNKVDVQKVVCMKPVQTDVEQTYTCMVPHEEIQRGVRKECRLVPGTCDKYETVEFPYECKVTVCRPEQRTRTVKVWSTQKEERTVEHPYCTIEARVIVKPYTVKECQWQKFVRTEPYEECVPYTVERQVQVKVCRMAPQTVRVPACCD